MKRLGRRRPQMRVAKHTRCPAGAGGWRSGLAPVSVRSGGSEGRWAKWKRNKCHLFDKAEFACGLVRLSLGSPPRQRALHSPGSRAGSLTERFPTLCLSCPVCQGRGGTPHTGLKMFLVVPNVTPSSDVPAPRCSEKWGGSSIQQGRCGCWD